jgi:hypothetical protein
VGSGHEFCCVGECEVVDSNQCFHFNANFAYISNTFTLIKLKHFMMFM